MLWYTKPHSSHLWEEMLVIIYFCACVNSPHNHLNKTWKIPGFCGTNRWCRLLPGEIHPILSFKAILMSIFLYHLKNNSEGWVQSKGKKGGCQEEHQSGINKFVIFFQEAIVVFQHKTHTYHLRNVLTLHSSAVLFPSYEQNN